MPGSVLQVCLGCGCRYSAGAPCCPQCRGGEWRADYEDEEGEVAKITALGGVSHPEEPDPGASGQDFGVDDINAPELAQEPVAEPEPEEPPGPTLVPASTPGPSSPASSEPNGEPEAAGPAAVEPEAAGEPAPAEPEPEAAPRPKAAPSLSRAKDAPAQITGSGGVVLPKAGASGG